MIKTICTAYLLFKSLLGRGFTYFDIDLAKALVNDCWWPGILPPAYLTMIANLSAPAKLPEAWMDFRWELCNR